MTPDPGGATVPGRVRSGRPVPLASPLAGAVVVAVVAALSLALGLSGPSSLVHGLDGHPWSLRVADSVFGSLAYLALPWRRRLPVAFAGYVLVVVTFSTLAAWLPYFAAFTVAVHRSWQTALVISALLVAAAWPHLTLYNDGAYDRGEVMFLITVLMVAVTGWGMFVRARRQLLASLRDRAERAEDTREQHALHARIAERQRIAREMHDVLAHRLSLLSVQAGALEFAGTAASEKLIDAAAAVRDTTHLALQELRLVVRVLRADDEDDTAAPQPVAADLPRLISESHTAAASMDCGTLDLSEVPPGAGRTLYRIVQEGLTNARKHAPASAVDITLTGAPADGLTLTVTSWLPVDRTFQTAIPGAGSGLIGLRERAVLSGGRIDAVITEDDRFQLSAWLPWHTP